ncbi:TIGR04222 domain-containing membrane protein [Gordonia phthalatica]|uniref:TIGR04222 domain-containing membrane protein n=1 Tax=Gordonia phthalatica TaxID=1136941 RepID=UPI0012FF29A0|nr:TIGR04222 domain-containing membrane protein [Gordonia phthalatica]
MTRLYVAVLLIVCATFAWRQFLLWRKRVPSPGRDLTPTEVGCLYGHRYAVAVALLWLDESADEHGHRSAEAVGGDAYTAYVAQRGRVLTSPTVEAVSAATHDHLGQMTDYLIGRDLLASKHDRRLVLAPLGAVLVLLAVVAILILVDGGGVDVIVPLVLMVGVLLAAGVLRARFGRTRAGDDYLRTMAQKYPAGSVTTARDRAYAVAVHGPAVLATKAHDRGEWHRSAVEALSTDDYRRQSVGAR